MPEFPPEVWAVIIIAMTLWLGAQEAWKGVKKVGHAGKVVVSCVVHPKACGDEPETTTTPTDPEKDEGGK